MYLTPDSATVDGSPNDKVQRTVLGPDELQFTHEAIRRCLLKYTFSHSGSRQDDQGRYDDGNRSDIQPFGRRIQPSHFQEQQPLSRLYTGLIAATVAWILATHPPFAKCDDWPQWGGPERDLVWRETGIVERLPEGPVLPRVWSTAIGEGYSGPAVADGRVFITDYQKETRSERILCLDATNGRILWKHAYPVGYTISYPAGPRSTPVVDSDRVYALGAMGNFTCLEVKTGKVIWTHDFPKEFDTSIPIWGMVASPLVLDQQLITLVGGRPDGLIISFDKKTGKELWRSLEDAAVGYCPPVLFEFAGKPQLIIWHPEAVSAIDPQNGKAIWEVPFRVRAGLTVPMPRQIGRRIFVTAFYNGPMMLEVAKDGQSARIVWKGSSDSEIKTDGLHSIMPTPVVTENNIYGICSYGQLRCLNSRTGERIWETLEATGSGRWWNAFLIPHEDRVFVHNEQGELIIAQLSPEGYRELSRSLLVEPTRPVRRRMTIWSHPAFAMKSVFARNDREIVRVNLARD